MATTTTTARTNYGNLRGVAENGVAIFRGIPYARPPVEQFRFAPPQPADGWTGTRDATIFGPRALQPAVAASAGLNTPAEQSEDCLTLNVWTPGVDNAHRPVMVYLHGGAFLTGAGSWPMYNGATLARRGDVVVVTINYRLGLFGYLRGIDICGEVLASTGNEGLLDQIAALTWVKQEIAAFGGDPENVTVFGTSAGSRSIALMLASPRARGLFHKGVMQSGPALANTPEQAARVMEAILADLGLAPSEAGRLRNLPAARLLDIQTRVTPRSAGIAYGPVADGSDIPSDPEAAIAGGSAAGIPVLVGTNLEEYKFYRRMDSAAETLTNETLLARLADRRTTAEARDNSSIDPAEAVALYRRERASRSESTVARDLWFAIMTDRRFRVPSMRLAELHAAHTSGTFTYLFTWQSPAWDGKLGAGHEVNTPFVFGTFDAPDSQELVPAGSPVGELPDQMQDAWIAFTRTGSPQTPALADWQPYTAGRRSTMLLGTSCGAVNAPFEAERRLWDARVAAGSTRF
jgi:para-nitrobenzyl esterase